MPFDTRYSTAALGFYCADLIAGNWITLAEPELTTNLYDLDEGRLSVAKYDAGASMTLSSIADYWIKKGISRLSGMYVTNLTARLTPGNIWIADLTLRGVLSAKLCRQTPSTSLKEMTVTLNDKTTGFNAETPAFTREYLAGPGVSVTMPPMPPAPPGFWFYGPAKSNSPNGWVRMESSVDELDGTPFKKVIEKFQWIHSAEPAGN